VFDVQVDTFDALHERSPFAVDCICMVAARVKCGGGPPSETFKKCLEEVQAISSATLFSPVSRIEAVQAMGKRDLFDLGTSCLWCRSLGLGMVRQWLVERGLVTSNAVMYG
jgi:hypothetical protein